MVAASVIAFSAITGVGTTSAPQITFRVNAGVASRVSTSASETIVERPASSRPDEDPTGACLEVFSSHARSSSSPGPSPGSRRAV